MKTVAIDFDGVIADTNSAKAEFAQEELDLDVDEYSMKQRHFIRIFGEDEGKKLYSQVIDGVYGSERMLTEVAPMPYAHNGIAQLRNWGYRCIILTSRYGPIDDSNSQAGWAWRFLGQHRFQVEKSDFFNVDNQSKIQVCLETGAFGLVDDNYSKLLAVIEAGLKGYLFSTKTNRDAETKYHPFLAIRVRNWHHLLEILSSHTQSVLTE